MKFVFIIVVIAIIAGGWYFIANPSGNEATQNDDEEMVEENEEGQETSSTNEGESGNESSDEGEAGGNEVTFDLTGKNFAFSETELTVKKGDTVTINFESTDGFHDWVVDEFDAATKQVGTGTPTSVTFVADESGSFEYYCSVGNHRALGMVGTLIVE